MLRMDGNFSPLALQQTKEMDIESTSIMSIREFVEIFLEVSTLRKGCNTKRLKSKIS